MTVQTSVPELLEDFIRQVQAVEFNDPGISVKIIDAIKCTLQAIVGIASITDSADRAYRFCGISTAVHDIFHDSPPGFLEKICEGLVFAARVLINALAADSIVAAGEDHKCFACQLSEPESDGGLVNSEHILTRLQCMELLAAGFFGIIRRGWRGPWSGTRDMPAFSFEKLWEYDTEKWNTKNFVLMGVMMYFHHMSQVDMEMLRAECLTITRKAIGKVSMEHFSTISEPTKDVFCPFMLQQDQVSIHGFTGNLYLLADFANQYLGGGVLSGGGSQEESMFVEYTELLATIFLIERLLPHEAVEISGVKKYVEHNMMGAPCRKRREQFCRPAVDDTRIEATVVAMDAINFNRFGTIHKRDQYQSIHIWREIRKCLVAISLPIKAGPAKVATRNFVTGLWGCGAFRGDIELKCIIQWICCSIEPSVEQVIFCPWDQHSYLTQADLLQLKEELHGKSVPVRQILEYLVDGEEYLVSPSTFQYLVEKIQSKRRRCN